jgi:hypothetical protein
MKKTMIRFKGYKGAITSNKSKIMSNNHQNSFKTITLLDIFLCYHWNAMLIMGSYVKWLIWTLKNSIYLNLFKLGFGINKKNLWIWTIVASKSIKFIDY